MKKLSIAIALSVIAVAAFAEYRIFINNPSEKNGIEIDLSDQIYQGNISDNVYVANIESPELKFEYGGISASDTDYRSVASELLEILDHVEKINQCSVKCNRDVNEDFSSTSYYKVVERKFSSVSDVKNYMSMSITDSLIEERYSEITDGPSPVLRDFPNGLYAKIDREPGKGFEWEKDENGNIVVYISETSPDSFTVNTTGHSIEIINDNHIWKINSVN